MNNAINNQLCARLITSKTLEHEKEKAIENRIKSYLKTVPDLFYWKEHGGMYGTVGIPDLIICYKGRFIALEVKNGVGRPSRMQLVQIDRINKSGGIATIVRSLEEVKAIIQSI